MRRDVPSVPKRVADTGTAIPVELIGWFLERSRPCSHRLLIQIVDIWNVQIEHRFQRLVLTVSFSHLHVGVPNLQRCVMDHAVRGRVPPKFLRIKRAFQEVDQGFCPARMEVGLNIGRALPLVVLALVSRDVPEVAGGISVNRDTLRSGWNVFSFNRNGFS